MRCHRLFWLILFCSALSGYPAFGVAGSQELTLDDLKLLTEVTCHDVETSKSRPNPERAEGDGYTSWGLCQIKYGTAITVGGLGPLRDREGFIAVFKVLGDSSQAKVVAYNIYVNCYIVLKRHTLIGLAACYNGPKLSYPPGVKRLLVLHAQDPEKWTDKKVATYVNLRIYAEKVEAAYKAAVAGHRKG